MPVMTFYTRRMPVMTFYIPGVCQYDLSYTRSMPALVYAWHMQMPFQFFLAKFGWSNLAYVGHTAQYKISRIPLYISLPGIRLAYTPENLHDWAQWLGNRDFLKMGNLRNDPPMTQLVYARNITYIIPGVCPGLPIVVIGPHIPWVNPVTFLVHRGIGACSCLLQLMEGLLFHILHLRSWYTDQ